MVVRRERPLAREIALLLAAKLIALSMIWYAFYRDPVIPSMTAGMNPEQVTAAVLRSSLETITPGSGDPE